MYMSTLIVYFCTSEPQRFEPSLFALNPTAHKLASFGSEFPGRCLYTQGFHTFNIRF